MLWIALTIPLAVFALVVAFVPFCAGMVARRRGGQQRSFERSVRADIDLIDAYPEVLDELRRSA